MQIDTDLQSFMAFNAQVPVEQNKLAENVTGVAVTFVRRSGNQDLLLNGTPLGLFDTDYDVEVYGVDIDAVEATTDTLKGKLHGFLGRMGSTQVLGAFVSEHADDYTPKVELNTDEGLNACTFALKVMHY